jgi:hypothetical protein
MGGVFSGVTCGDTNREDVERLHREGTISMRRTGKRSAGEFLNANMNSEVLVEDWMGAISYKWWSNVGWERKYNRN